MCLLLRLRYNLRCIFSIIERKGYLDKPSDFTVTPLSVVLIMQTCKKRQIIYRFGLKQFYSVL